MAKSPKILDSSGRPFDGSDDDDSDKKLPLAIQALVETRLNSAVDDIRERNREDLKEISRDQVNRWRWITAIATVSSLSVFVYVPLQVKAWLNEQVDKKLTEPMIRESADRVISIKMAGYVDNKLKPLEKRAASLEGSIGEVRTDIESKSKSLEIQQDKLSKQLKITELSIAAKAGSRSAYDELLKLNNDAGGGNEFLVASVKEIEFFFDVDRNQLSYMTLVSGDTMKDPGYSSDEVIARMHAAPDMQVAAINTLARLKNKATVMELCRLLSVTTNLHVATRITRALEEITGEKFRPLEFDRVTKWWRGNERNPLYRGNYGGYLETINGDAGQMKTTELPYYISRLAETCESDPGAYHALCLRAAFLIMLNRDDEANALLKGVPSPQRNRWCLVWTAAVKIKKDDLRGGVDSINQAFSVSSDFEIANEIKKWLIFSPVLMDKSIKWPSQASGAK